LGIIISNRVKYYYVSELLLAGRAELNFGLDGTQSGEVQIFPNEIRRHLDCCQQGIDGTTGYDQSSPLEIEGKTVPWPQFETR
jgi:hypothetical protein